MKNINVFIFVQTFLLFSFLSVANSQELTETSNDIFTGYEDIKISEVMIQQEL